MLKLIVTTPERKVLEVEADEVSVPGALGYLGILPQHSPLLSTLGTGELSYRSGVRERYLVIQGGFVEVADDRVTILADRAQLPDEIDVEKARRDQAAAEEKLKGSGDHDFVVAQAELELAVTQIQVAGRV